MLVTLGFAALGAVAGSFVGVVAERAYTGQSFLTGRSRCNSCARTLGPVDLVPMLSWLFSAGKCRGCGSRVPWSYAVLEGVLAILFAAAYVKLGLSVSLLLFLLAVVTLAFIVVYDLRHTIVPPESSMLLTVLSVLFAWTTVPTASLFGAALLIAGVIALLFLALHAFSGGRAMGLGDAPVAFALSTLVAPYAVAGLLFSFWIGALCGIAILMSRQGGPRMGLEVPFVPFLAAGYLLAYFTQWNPLALALP